jgi:hypothetical protein
MTMSDDASETTVSAEAAYEAGSRRTHLQYLSQALRSLGRDGPEWDAARLIGEREEAIAVLRRICTEHGDNDWHDDLHLADIIDKYLGRHLDG